MSSPASRLSVANSASAADSGSVGVSSAITVTPALRASSTLGTTPRESTGVIRIPFTPERTMLPMASTWLRLSTSLRPTRTSSARPSRAASRSAVSRICLEERDSCPA